MGPGGLGSIAGRSRRTSLPHSVITKSALILLGLVLFLTTAWSSTSWLG